MAFSLTYALLLLVLGILAVIIAQAVLKKAKPRKMWTWIGVAMIGVFAVSLFGISQLSFLNGTIGLGGSTLAIAGGQDGASQPTTGSNLNVAVNPSATYNTVDKFTGATVSGTSYYKENGKPATTTALSNVNPGETYAYWVSNATTYYVAPKIFTAGTLNNNIVNDQAVSNATNTIVIFDALGNQNIQGGIANVSMGAGDTKNLNLKYQGTYQASSLPFGGVFIVEVNQTISQVTCTGADISTTVPYSQVTYTDSSTANKHLVWYVAPTLDDGTSSVHEINCQFKNGATDTSSNVIFNFIPANWYKANDGTFQLDVQKSANSDTTRVGLGKFSATAYFT